VGPERLPAFRERGERVTPTPAPRAHLLSNGRYSVMITDAGSGYSRWHDLAITRWREDATCDADGAYVFLRDVIAGDVWSVGYQPSGREPDEYAVAFSEDRAEIVRRDGAITSRLEVIVSPEDDVELRRVTLTNTGALTREIELTSYAEVVLASPASDAVHPAFSNLFVHTEYVSAHETLLATRRSRAPDEPALWVGHVLAVDGETVAALEWETDRAQFLGRGRSIRTAVSVMDGRALSNTVGSVLDPIVSLRRRVRIPPGQRAVLTFSTLVAPSRDAVLALADKYRECAVFERIATLARVHANLHLKALRIGVDEALLFQTLVAAVVYANRALRASGDTLTRQPGGQEVLWSFGISGDRPIVLLVIEGDANTEIVTQLLHAHEYWRTKCLAIDLVVLNDAAPSDAQALHALLEPLFPPNNTTAESVRHRSKGEALLLRGEKMTAQQRGVLAATARVALSSHGTLAEQIARAHSAGDTVATPLAAPTTAHTDVQHPPPNLEFFNGLGGFTPDGREYVTVLEAGERTPAPWINVIANESFGCQVSESGSGYTWSVNSQENQLTEWSNDAVSDPPSEALYVRDEETGELWGPTALPIREENEQYVSRHGPGYSRFEHSSHGIALELLQFVPLDDSIKVSRLTLTNQSGRPRRLSVTAYVKWVLGVSRGGTAPFIVTELDAVTNAMFARNSWRRDFGERVAFADLGGTQTAWTGDRTEFLGRYGTLARPAALAQNAQLSGRIGAALDPCCALQTMVVLPEGGSVDVKFFLGDAASKDEARHIIGRYRAADLEERLRSVAAQWDDALGTVRVTTPDRSMDLMLNHWLLYQVLACRVWARTAFYQASGAYGFRDQLQDVMALTVSRPAVARQHLLRAAARQFVEGDVQHWWHPPVGRGIRTRVSDDLLWLPYVVNEYLAATGDANVLDEIVPFLEGPLLAASASESYFEPRESPEHATLFEHCSRAINRSLAVGSHGLPLMGTGDWNDGMNRVGAGGKGESVWLGWFLCAVFRDWSTLADARGEGARAETWRSSALALQQSLEREAWDGEWYRRAFFDDGSPLGSAVNDACRIDSIAQSWSVISGAADVTRSQRATASLETHLVKGDDGIALLLTPPFDDTPPDPGYIKGYLPGIRENGGQYTHAATWTVVAFAQLGDGDKAAELFAMLNPITHGGSASGVQRYQVEPYVMAGDVYGEPPHVGRGGWTWYTGAAGWMYRAGLEWILGFRLRGTRLVIDPCIPRAWPGFSMVFRYHSARYEIVVENPSGVCRVVSSLDVDGVPVEAQTGIPLVDDGQTHQVHVVLGGAPPSLMTVPVSSRTAVDETQSPCTREKP
jgi:cyclic beta-1,2-glucan synthetase